MLPSLPHDNGPKCATRDGFRWGERHPRAPARHHGAVPELLSSIADLAWPVVVLLGLVLFARPLAGLLRSGSEREDVTIEVGANDACADDVAGMTTTASFAGSVQTTLATLSAGAAQPQIFVASIPNLKRLWELTKSSLSARIAWAASR